MGAFLTPAIIVSAVAFLTLLFGRIIADERAYADDRNWHIQLSGFVFVLIFIPIQSLVGYSAAHFMYIWFGSPLLLQGLYTLLAALELLILLVIADWLMKRRYPFFGRSHASKLFEMFESEMVKDPEVPLQRKLLAGYRFGKTKLLERDPRHMNFISSSTAYFAYAVSFALISNNYFFLVVNSVIGLGGLLLAAYIRSMQLAQTVQVNICFLDKHRPLKNVTLLRVNDDNVKVRESERTVLYNKSLIFQDSRKSLKS